MPRELYELVGSDPLRRFSPFCWRIRMALAHKGLEATVVPWRFTETARLAFANWSRVPVLVDGDQVVTDSPRIARYLDEAYPHAPSLFHGAEAARRFAAEWANTVLQPAVARLVVADIPALLDPADRDYFVASREQRFGMPLERLREERAARLPEFRALLQPLRSLLADQAFLGGSDPDYADYAVFGAFQWARCVSPFALLAPDDAVHAWRERLLDAHGGVARAAPGFD